MIGIWNSEWREPGFWGLDRQPVVVYLHLLKEGWALGSLVDYSLAREFSDDYDLGEHAEESLKRPYEVLRVPEA